MPAGLSHCCDHQVCVAFPPSVLLPQSLQDCSARFVERNNPELSQHPPGQNRNAREALQRRQKVVQSPSKELVRDAPVAWDVPGQNDGRCWYPKDTSDLAALSCRFSALFNIIKEGLPVSVLLKRAEPLPRNTTTGHGRRKLGNISLGDFTASDDLRNRLTSEMERPSSRPSASTVQSGNAGIET